jgi:acetyl esterase/lipase
MKLRICAAALAALIAFGPAGASDPAVLPLYPAGTVKPLPVPERTEDLFHSGQMIVRNVSEPSLTVFLPDPAKANGTAVIVAPGGGFMMLSFDSEGTLVAKQLAAEGVTAFVLKYRLTQTPEDPAAMLIQFTAMLKQRAAGQGAKAAERVKAEAMAAEDAAAAVRLVRQRAAEWKLDPKRIGLIGFSAGAITTARVAIGEVAGRPDFAGIIYGAVNGTVPADAPPAFIATAADDPLLANAPIPAYQAWKAAGRPAELHIFESGGHGFGLVPKGTTSDHWMDEFVWWMSARGLLPAKK